MYLKERWYALAEARWTRLVFCVFGALLALAPLLFFPAYGRVPLVAQMFAGRMPLLIGMAAVLFACGVFFVISVLMKSPAKNFLALFVYLLILGVVYHTHFMPAVDRNVNSVRLITDRLSDAQKAATVCSYGFNSPALIYYMGRPVPAILGLDDALLKKDDIIVIAEDKYGSAEALETTFSPFEESAVREGQLLDLHEERWKVGSIYRSSCPS